MISHEADSDAPGSSPAIRDSAPPDVAPLVTEANESNGVQDSAAAGDSAPPDVEVPAAVEAQDSASLPGMLRSMQATLERIEGKLGQVDLRSKPLAAPVRPALALPQSLNNQLAWLQIAALATALLVVFLRLIDLDQLQNELYGDIALIYEYIAAIRARTWPTYFTLSSGPLYHYLIMPVVAITGPTYYGFKLASVLTSLGVLAATYALSRRLIDDRFAVLAAFVAGVSSWLLLFSRLGNSQILVPLLATCALWLALRVAQGGGARDVIACAIVSAMGFYVYPQSFVLSPVIGLTLLCLRWTGMPIKWSALWRFAITTVVCALPLAWIISRDPYNFFTGYIGGKLGGGGNPLVALLTNVTNGLLAFHFRGDGIFRSNPPGLPHLDWVSGLLFLGGLVFWLLPKQRRLSPLLLVPFLLLQAPSWLVLSRPDEVPSASRTLGVAPITYILVASGLWWLLQLRRPTWPRWLVPTVVGVLLAAILLLNIQRYFRDYIAGLPYQNTPIGRIVATYLDALPPETQIYMVGCCWEHSLPEPLSVQYVMARPERFSSIESSTVTCDWLQLQPQPVVLVWSFYSPLPSPAVEACQSWLPAQLYTSKEGLPAFLAAPLRLDLAGNQSGAALPPAPPPPPPGDPQLNTTMVEIESQLVRVEYSPIDMGEIVNVFDQQDDTLIRGLDANPLVLDLEFAQPRSISTIMLTIAAMQHVQITASLTNADGETINFAREFRDLEDIPIVDLASPSGPIEARRLRVEILDLAPLPADGRHIHVRELRLQ